jgi:hypothetical protein
VIGVVVGCLLVVHGKGRGCLWIGTILFFGGSLIGLTGHTNCQEAKHGTNNNVLVHGRDSVAQGKHSLKVKNNT